MVSQKQKILSFLSKNPNAKSKEVATALKLNYNSVRGRISELKKNNLVRLTEKSKYKISPKGVNKIIKQRLKQEKLKETKIEPVEFYRKIVKGLQYCSGKKQNVYALTYEKSQLPDRSNKLLRAIEKKHPKCSDLMNFGYDDNQQVINPPFTYSDIEVGKE